MEECQTNVIEISKVVDNDRKTVCFTSHRPNKPAGYTSRVPYTMFVRTLKEMIIPFIGQGYTRFITRAAQKIDQLAFWAVEGLKKAGCPVQNIVYVPYEGQESRNV